MVLCQSCSVLEDPASERGRQNCMFHKSETGQHTFFLDLLNICSVTRLRSGDGPSWSRVLWTLTPRGVQRASRVPAGLVTVRII